MIGFMHKLLERHAFFAPRCSHSYLHGKQKHNALSYNFVVWGLSCQIVSKTSLKQKRKAGKEEREREMCNLCIKRSFYQDRLGTNIAKTQKAMRCFWQTYP
eukprot:COSAG06_NODE_859_length_11882_cov_31.614701_13_plen_101_part_00